MITVLFQLFIFTGLGLLLHNKIKGVNSTFIWQKTVGESFFIGVFIIVIINNFIQIIGFPFQPSILSYTILFLSIGSFLQIIYQNKNSLASLQTYRINFRSNIFSFLLIGIVLIHLYSIIRQNQTLPLIPWDAWNSWVAKAKIWYFHDITEALVNRPKWLLTDALFTNPTAHYPDGLPLLYIFNSGFYGWNETKLNAIYPALYIAFLFAFYGNIKLLTNKNHSLIATFLLATIPFINTHVTLAGYADIWISAFIILTLFNLQQLLNKSQLPHVISAIIFASSLVLFKLESWVWLIIIFITIGLCLIAPAKRKWVYSILFIVFVLWYFTGGFSINSPFGLIVIEPSLIQVPILGKFPLHFVNTTSSWLEALFLSNNWNVIWYSMPFTFVAYFKIKNKESLTLPALFLVFATIFLYILFYLTYASVFASDFTSSNRIVLHIVPVYLYFAIQVAFQYQMQKSIEGSS